MLKLQQIISKIEDTENGAVKFYKEIFLERAFWFAFRRD